MRRKTLKDVAQLAGVSYVTVSLALRSHPRISQETRTRVLTIAKRIGYRPDPVLSALMVYRHGNRPSGNQETLAWINVWPKPNKLKEAYGPYWDGALERCNELGYNLQELRLVDFGMSPRRLSRALRTRNIHGLLIPPQYHSRAHLNLEWEHFSAVAFGYTLARPKLHLVSNAQFRSAVIAIRALRKLGHRRIGMSLEHYLNERTDHNYVGGYLTEQLRSKSADQIPLLVLDDESSKTRRKLLQWYEKYQPDAILTGGWFTRECLESAGYRPARDFSLSMLYLRNSDDSGIDQNECTTGRTAVDILVGMLHRSERGIPPIPLRTLVEGQWVEGKTVRRLIPVRS